MKEGWICPRCGKVNAPFIPECSCDNRKYRSNYRKPCPHDWIFDGVNEAGIYFYHCPICGSTTTSIGHPIGSEIIK